MKFLIVILLLLTSSSYAGCISCHADTIISSSEVIAEAKKYLYVREKTNRNDAPEIDLWLKNCGLGKGYPYCAAFVSSMYQNTYRNHNLKTPYPMNASVARFTQSCVKNPMKFKVISTREITWGIDYPREGDIASWMHGKLQYANFNYKGHFGLVKYSDNTHNIYTIEGNTKPESKTGKDIGDQSGTKLGDFTGGQEGVYERKRHINLYSNFPIAYFIRLK